MNSLQSKIQEAAQFFQTHDFKKSLQLYDQCISICKKNQQSKTLLHNLMSSKGALMSILGDQKGALNCLNQVLSQDPYHTLCLMRRSQVLKKKNKLNKALKDLKQLQNFSPDNLQIVAMKVQIQNLKLKSKQVNSSSSESQQESEKSSQSVDLDEQQKLNFSNLKIIDRKSVSIMVPNPSSRKSRVTIAGDIAIQYDAPDDQKDDKSFASTNVSKEYAKEKFMKTFRQIELDDQLQTSSNRKQSQIIIVPKIKTNTNGRTKSILKNRDSALYINTNSMKALQKDKKYGGRQSKMVDLLKNIDGKVIASTCSQRSSKSIKEVEFRKSLFGVNQINVSSLQAPTNQSSNFKPKTTRKSCIKRPSFELPKQTLQVQSGTAQPRRSKFDSMSKVGIDGIVIKSKRKSIEYNQAAKQNIKNESDSDEGSQHNIFGSNQIVISRQIRQNLGLGQDSNQIKKVAKPRTEGSKSILKKNSVVIKSIEKSNEPSPFKEAKKAKKSVMFTRPQQ